MHIRKSHNCLFKNLTNFCRMLSTFFIVISLSLTHTALAKIALISTSAEPITAFETAREASALGAKILLYPEWGYLTDSKELDEKNYMNWKTLAQELKVYVVLGVRYKARNTIFVFPPEGKVEYSVRRDGINSPNPTLEAEKKALIINTYLGRFAILICDESRAQKYLSEIAEEKLEGLLVPNFIGAATDRVTLIKRYENFFPVFTRFNSDRLPQISGSETHVFRNSGVLEFNSFGKIFEIGTFVPAKKDPSGISYSISVHEIN